MEKSLTSEIVFEGLIFKVERIDIALEDGTRSRRDVVRHRGAVGLVVQRSDGAFVFVRQYRKAVEQRLLEVVAGTLDPREPPEACALRELEEETGYTARSITRLGHLLPSPGYVDERIEIFYARVDTTPGKQKLDHDERVDVVLLTRDEIGAAIDDETLCDGKSLAAWCLFLQHEPKLRDAP